MVSHRGDTPNTRAKIDAMPIYEYDCGDCRRVVSVLVLRPSAAEPPRCPRCHGASLTRVMSRFATIKSEDARLESFADPANFGDVDENDPASVARFMKKMGQEMGDDLGDDFDEAVDEAMNDSASDEEGADSVPSSGSGDDL
jgi:putative FmdB family regulatory protein